MSSTNNLSYMHYATNNVNAIEKSTECACIFCFKKFIPQKITNWITECDGSETALCPYCHIDSVIPNNSVAYTNSDIIRWHNEGFGSEEDFNDDQLELQDVLMERYGIIDKIKYLVRNNRDIISKNNPGEELDLDELSFDELSILLAKLTGYIQLVHTN